MWKGKLYGVPALAERAHSSAGNFSTIVQPSCDPARQACRQSWPKRAKAGDEPIHYFQVRRPAVQPGPGRNAFARCLDPFNVASEESLGRPDIIRSLGRDGAAMKHVTDTMHGDHKTRPRLVPIKFSPEMADVHVNGAGGGAAGIELPDLLKQFIARNRAAGLAGQAGQ
jgi:hypothetical protein